MASTRYRLTKQAIRTSLDKLAASDPRIAKAIEQVGYPDSRRREHGFDPLVRIVVGQQVSTHAARAIAGRLVDTVGGHLTAQAIIGASDESLRSAGLSRQKVSYLRALSEAVHDDSLPIDALPQLADADVVSLITAVRGFGEWSAHMYLMFSLGRPDVWPVGDLAVRAGFGRLLGLEERPTPKQTHILGEAFAPHRSALALLCWKYYSEAPL